MTDAWLTVVGLGEDGLAGLSDVARQALADACVIFGGPRHLDLIGAGLRGRRWPVPFSVDPVLALRGTPVVVLASGDPFWFGVGAVLADRLDAREWVSHPAPSVFQLAANLLGWRMERIACHGLHAAPFEQLRSRLHPQARLVVTLADGGAPSRLAAWLDGPGWGGSDLWVMEALGGPRQRIRQAKAQFFDLADIAAPVVVALIARGGAALPRTAGLPDDLFASDGQMTKAPVRALTIAALAPRPELVLWDLGAGSGSISVEWCLAGGQSVAVEQHASRVSNIKTNIAYFGLDDRCRVLTGDALALLPDLPLPGAVFIGGGATAGLLGAVWDRILPDVRIVVNSVTLETDALLAEYHAMHGGALTRIDIAQATPLGGMRGWQASRTVTQWSGVR